jgi:V/A-type H+-transporting ATPase subunit I
MIVAMSRVLIVGPKIISAEVIRLLHKMGRLHITPVKNQGALHPAVLDSGEAVVKHTMDRLQQELDGLLTVLGFQGRPAQAALPADWENLLAHLVVQRAEINQLIKQKLDLADELALIENYRAAFEALSPLMSKLEPSRRIKAFGFMAKLQESAAVDALQKELRKLTEGRVEFYRHQVDEKKLAVLAAFHIGDEEKIKGFFTKAGVNELKLPSTVASLNMAEAVSQLKEKSRRLPEMISETSKRISEISRQEGPVFEAYRLMAGDELARLQAKEELPEGRFTFYLQGYLPAEDLPVLKELLFKKFGDQVSVKEIEIGPRDGGKTPVMLKNNPLVKPFELLLAIFNPPQYGSIDPTPFVAIFFPIYFGFIIGDVGYGAVLGSVSLFLFFKFKAKEIFRSLAIIFILCSFWAVVFGVIYGELFGEVGEHLHIIAPLTENLNRMKKGSVFLLLGVSLAFGLIQVFTGLIIALINGIRHRDRHHILEPTAFMAALLSIFGLIGCLAGLLPQALLIPAIAGLVASAGLMVGLVGVAGPIEIFGAVGNILSYSRLFAIGLSAVYLAFAANKLGSLIGASGELWAVILGTVLAAVLFHPLFFAIGLISPIVQPARLQFVEFFTKFKYFDNPGKQYKPFKTKGGK